MGVSNKMEEKELIAAILQGDSPRYRLLVERYQDMVYSLALRITGSEEEAGEAAQDSFLKAFRSLATFQGEAKFSTWLYRIAFNTSVSYKRKQKPTVRFSIQVHGGSSESISHPEQEDKKRWLNLALKRLSPDDAGVITLFYMQELSLEEMAEITGMKANAVKVKLHRARKKLGDELKKLLADEAKILA
jgi:RNA polymerase sigma factor (sigma-70 family)